MAISPVHHGGNGQFPAVWRNGFEARHGLDYPSRRPKPDEQLLKDVIDIYNTDKLRTHGKTKDQVLRSIKNADIGDMRCSEITSQDLVRFAQSIDAQPSTRGNYMSHLASIFSVARPAWGYPLDKQAMDDARVVLDRLGLIGRSKQRSHRPTLQELDKLMNYYTVIEIKGLAFIPMMRIIPFAIFSTRRQEEITTIARKDLDKASLEVIVRNMKNPGEKSGNDVPITLTPEALKFIKLQPASFLELMTCTSTIYAMLASADCLKWAGASPG